VTEERPCRDAAELGSHRVELFEQVVVRKRLIVLGVPVDSGKTLQFGPAAFREEAIDVVLADACDSLKVWTRQRA
jgi:hypothetical protein